MDADLRDGLLELANVIQTEQNWRDQGREIWVENLGTKSLPADRHERLNQLIAYGARLRAQRADEIREAAKVAGKDVAAMLYHAATRLDNGDQEVPRMLAEAAATLQCEQTATPKVESTNDDRDAWMYKQKKNRQTHKQILAALNSDYPDWDSLETEQAVHGAIKRYCERHDLPLLRRKK